MGVERAVTRWYVQRQIILDEIVALQASLINLQTASQPPAEQLDSEVTLDTETPTNAASIAEIERKLADAQSRLLTLGPCPKSMMG